MPASFPSTIKSFANLTDYIDRISASDMTERASEITAIETALGASMLKVISSCVLSASGAMLYASSACRAAGLTLGRHGQNLGASNSGYPAWGADSGTAFPTSACSGDKFFRTDLGWLCYDDGTRWLTVHEWSVSISYIGLSVDSTLFAHALRTDYNQYFTRVAIKTKVAALNDGTKYWTIISYIWNLTQATATALDTFNTSADTAATWTNHERAPATTSLPGATNKHYASANMTKTSTPGNIDIYATWYYRLIVT